MHGVLRASQQNLGALDRRKSHVMCEAQAPLLLECAGQIILRVARHRCKMGSA